MAGFIYNGKSTKDILSSSELILCTFDGIDSVSGHQREDITGETTISRPIANEYGTQYEPLEIEYGLIKKDHTVITSEEQRTIEKWLTSPKISQELTVIDCQGNPIDGIYHGKFISTEWYPVGGGWAGFMFNFKNNTAYPTKHFEQTYSINSSGTITIDCETDELEEYVYPTITVVQSSSSTATVSITNVTDNSNKMTIQTRRNLPMIFDCLHCIPKDGTTSGIITYQDLGWDDVGNIYWPRLLPGRNTLRVEGNVQITIEFDYPYKRVGGWL